MERDGGQQVEKKPLLLPGFNAVDKYFDWLIMQNEAVLDIVNDAYDRLENFLNNEVKSGVLNEVTDEDVVNLFSQEFTDSIEFRDEDGDRVSVREVAPETLEWINALELEERRETLKKLGVIVYAERGIATPEDYYGALDAFFNQEPANQSREEEAEEGVSHTDEPPAKAAAK